MAQVLPRRTARRAGGPRSPSTARPAAISALVVVDLRRHEVHRGRLGRARALPDARRRAAAAARDVPARRPTPWPPVRVVGPAPGPLALDRAAARRHGGSRCAAGDRATRGPCGRPSCAPCTSSSTRPTRRPAGGLGRAARAGHRARADRLPGPPAARAAIELALRSTTRPGDEVTVLLPRRTYSAVVGRLLHDRTADDIARRGRPAARGGGHDPAVRRGAAAAASAGRATPAGVHAAGGGPGGAPPPGSPDGRPGSPAPTRRRADRRRSPTGTGPRSRAGCARCGCRRSRAARR